MNKAEAISLVHEAFDADYSAQSFVRFVSNLFKGEYTALDKRRDGQYVREAFRAFVQGYRILGTYEDAEGTNLDILEVTLQRESSLDRARTAQRNFVADYLKKNGRNAALVAFLSPDQHDWRFSLVKLEYSLEVKDGKLKIEEELTPAKRWSFLIGRHEGSHTVQRRFVSLLQDAEKPLLKELEEAFNIESVTDEFFNKYCELFFRMKESLDKLVEGDPAIKADFDSKELTTVDFAKKTLGQMAFLYFLQKKGWFGVKAGEPWGTGRKDFLRLLFTRHKDYGDNFFDDILEPLFYEALAQDRGIDAIYPKLNNVRMPFLNGGLFEPMNGYSWETTNILLPNELFSNSNRTAEGDVGDGILDIFDRYNFTVNESEPLEKEVAVDPEMLGKVFENLLEVNDRKSKGTFYTPREIVHFMCQESLINYLSTELKKAVPREKIEALIRNGSQIIQNDALVLESIRSCAQELDNALANIKVCDPAVGSGAFPLGMLNEIVQARQALAVHLRSDQSTFNLKLHSISHSLYGVDIDPGAVEIAKLRLWLALVVEENEPHPLPNLEHKVMQGNSLISEYEGVKLFDDNFLEEANHLEKESAHVDTRLSELQREYFALHSQDDLSPVKKEEFEREIRSLNKKKKALNTPNELHGQELSIFDAPGKFEQEQQKAQRLQKKIDQYISESQRTKKQQLKEEIELLKWQLVEASLKEQGKLDHLDALMRLRSKNIRPFFIWKLEFSDVFKDNGGFDIVIANPPYVGEKGNKQIFQSISQGNLGKFYHGQMDLFYFFFHLSLELGREKSQHAFITTNYYITARGARTLRGDLRERATIKNLINFNELRIFESALGQHNMVTIFSKESDLLQEARTFTAHGKGTASNGSIRAVLQGNILGNDVSIVQQKYLYDGEENYIRLRGTNTSDDPISTSLFKIKSVDCLLGQVANVNVGLYTGADKVTQKHIDTYALQDPKGSGIFVISEEEKDNLLLSFEERQYLVPFFKNSDIYKYSTNNINSRYLLNFSLPSSQALTPKDAPNLFAHITNFRNLLEGRRSNDNGLQSWIKRGYWWAFTIRQIDFSQPKIVAPQRSKSNTFGYNENVWFASADVYFITSQADSGLDLKYLLAILNSKLIFVWLYHRGKRKGESLELYQKPLSEIPIKRISFEDQLPFIEAVDEILRISQLPEYQAITPPPQQIELQKKIDDMVFKLYRLDQQEIIAILDSCGS